jgi:hypothetical protein
MGRAYEYDLQPPGPYFNSTHGRSQVTHRFREWWELCFYEKSKWFGPRSRRGRGCSVLVAGERWTGLRPKALCGTTIVHPRYHKRPFGNPCLRCEEIEEQLAADAPQAHLATPLTVPRREAGVERQVVAALGSQRSCGPAGQSSTPPSDGASS